MKKAIELSPRQMKEVVGGDQKFRICPMGDDFIYGVCTFGDTEYYVGMGGPICVTDADCFAVGLGEGKCNKVE